MIDWSLSRPTLLQPEKLRSQLTDDQMTHAVIKVISKVNTGEVGIMAKCTHGNEHHTEENSLGHCFFLDKV